MGGFGVGGIGGVGGGGGDIGVRLEVDGEGVLRVRGMEKWRGVEGCIEVKGC